MSSVPGLKQGARRQYTTRVMVDEDLRRRMKRYLVDVSQADALVRLGLGKVTLEIACHGGTLKTETLARLRETLAREEAALGTRVA